MAAKINTTDATTSVIGWEGETWTSSAFRTRLTANDAASPTIGPIPNGSIPSMNTSLRISRADAPLRDRDEIPLNPKVPCVVNDQPRRLLSHVDTPGTLLIADRSRAQEVAELVRRIELAGHEHLL